MRILGAILGAILGLLIAGRAEAACSVPFTFFNNNQSADANQLNANFNALVTCTNGLSAPFATSAAALTTLSAGLGSVIVVSQSVPAAVYTGSMTACQFNDGGSQIPAAGGGCWKLAAQTMYDIRWWSLNALNLYVAAGGNDYGGANFCVIQALPCKTLSQAVQTVARFAFNLNTNNAQINVGPGTFAGASVGGNFYNASGTNREPCLYIVGSGPSTHFTNDLTNGTQVWDIAFAGNACGAVENFDTVELAGGYGIFLQDGGTHVLISGSVSCTGPASGPEAQTCLHTEGGAYIELPPSGTTLTVQGNFGWIGTIGATPAKMTFDPGSGGSISCGTGLTLDSANGGSFLVDGSALTINAGWSWNSNCTGIVGHPVVALHNAIVSNLSGSPFPNVGSFKIQDNSVVTPNPVPAVSSCTNGSVVNSSPLNPNNNTFQVLFTGANTSCEIEFGSFLTNQFWFTNKPLCQVSGSNQLKGLGITYPTNGVTITPQSAFGADDTINVYCPAPAQG